MPTEPRSDQAAATPPGPAPKDAAAAPAPAPASDKGPLSKIVKYSLILLVVLFVYHLFADRITPYSSQATIDTFLVQIAPEVAGPVKAVGVVDNHPVKKGQVLFQIDPVPFRISLQSAEASLALALQNAGSSEADIRVADAQLKRQQIELATNRELGSIILDLAEKKALSQTQAIRARSEIEKTEADITRSIAEAERARIRLGETGANNAQVRQAAAAVEQAKLDLNRSTVRAPADGVVTNLRLAPGQFANKGSPVMSFISDGPRWVTVAMRENQLGNIAPGNVAYVVFDDRPGEVFPARVQSVGWGVSQGDEVPNGQLPQVTAPTGWLREPQRFQVRIMVDPPEDPEEQFPPGRSGAQANVVVLTRETSIMNPIARLYIRVIAILSFLQ